MAGFATYFHRYLYSCPSECFAVSRLQGNFTSAQVRSFILDFNNPFDRRLASIFQAIFINSLSPWVVIACLIESYILRTLVDVSLNYTRLNSLKQKYPIYIFSTPKLSLFVFFIATFINLMAALLALSVEIREMHKTDRAKNSIDLDTINGLLQVFGTTTFRTLSASLQLGFLFDVIRTFLILLSSSETFPQRIEVSRLLKPNFVSV